MNEDTLHTDMMTRMERNQTQGDDKNIGQEVRGHISLVELLGSGAMGAVYLGYDTYINRQVAVKVLLREKFKNPADFEYMKKLLIEEAKSLGRVDHPGVIKILEVDPDYPALIMEYIRGVNLHTFLYERKDRWATPGFRLWFLSIMEQIAFALGAAHTKGVIHKDLKFSNIMIYQDEDRKWKVKLIDFGLAQSLKILKLTHAEILLGTPSYMAPEQWEDVWDIDSRADVYSFGVMLYEILMRCDFHVAKSRKEIRASVKDSNFLHSRIVHLPIDQRSFFLFLLAIERSERAGGMLEVVGVLRRFRLELMARNKEFPGTSFLSPGQQPTSAQAKAQAEAEAEVPIEKAEEQFEAELAKKPANAKESGTMIGPPPMVDPSVDPAPAQAQAQDAAPAQPAQELKSIDIDLIGLDGSPSPAKSKKGRWVAGLFILLLVVAGAGVFMYLERISEDPKTSGASEQVADASVPHDAKPTPLPDVSPKPDAGLPSLAEQVQKAHDDRERWCITKDPRRKSFTNKRSSRNMWTIHLDCHYKHLTFYYKKERYEVALLYAQKLYKRFCTDYMRKTVYEKSLNSQCNWLMWRYKKLTKPLWDFDRVKYRKYRQYKYYANWLWQQRKKKKKPKRTHPRPR